MNPLKALLLCVIMIGFSNQLFSQQVIIGNVYTVKKDPIPGVTVRLGNSNSYYYAITDIDGEFALRVKENAEKSITFSGIGYHTVVINQIDTINHPLTIIMKEDLSEQLDFLRSYPNSYNPRFGFTMSMTVESMYSDFNEFESTLERYNTDYMSGLNASVIFGFA